MNLLLDTHTVIWYLEGDDENLSARAKDAIEDSRNSNYISMASVWEMAIKIKTGKLTLTKDFNTLPLLFERNNFRSLSIDFNHTQRLLNLELLHRDPFDRLIISQALEEGFQIVTKDNEIKQYSIKTIW